jgi:TatD DNase family protein
MTIDSPHNQQVISITANDIMASSAARHRVVDVGVNLTHKAFRDRWKDVVRQSIDAGVDTILLTGTCLERSRQSMKMAQQWLEEEGGTPNLYFTVGVHPHDAKTWEEPTTAKELKDLLKHPLAVAVGECGLDYNRNFSSKSDQRLAFRRQVELACECDLPLFVHEREAHEDLIQVLDEVAQTSKLPPIVVHCFTGTEGEALDYIERGYYVGFTGTICKKERGAPLRAFLPKLPLNRLMVETDAPFMGFQKGRHSSVPADCADVAKQLGETMGVSLEEVCDVTTNTALTFFRIPK